MKQSNYFFSFEGRINRLIFIAYQFLVGIVIILLSFIVTFSPQIIGVIVGITLMSIWLWSCLSLAARRAHDIGLSGWFCLILLVPLFNLLLFILPGNAKQNKYGDAPEPNSKTTIALASIAILTTLVPFTFGLLATAPTPESAWAYESNCNDIEHKEIHKIFEGKGSGLKQCSEFSNQHFDNFKGHKNKNGESHSTGCKLVKAPFPWSLSLEENNGL